MMGQKLLRAVHTAEVWKAPAQPQGEAAHLQVIPGGPGL